MRAAAGFWQRKRGHCPCEFESGNCVISLIEHRIIPESRPASRSGSRLSPRSKKSRMVASASHAAGQVPKTPPRIKPGFRSEPKCGRNVCERPPDGSALECASEQDFSRMIAWRAQCQLVVKVNATGLCASRRRVMMLPPAASPPAISFGMEAASFIAMVGDSPSLSPIGTERLFHRPENDRTG